MSIYSSVKSESSILQYHKGEIKSKDKWTFIAELKNSNIIVENEVEESPKSLPLFDYENTNRQHVKMFKTNSKKYE